MNIRDFVLVPVLLCLSACSGSGGGGAVSTASVAATPVFSVTALPLAARSCATACSSRRSLAAWGS